MGKFPSDPSALGRLAPYLRVWPWSAIVPGLGHDLTLLRALGLGLFCYTVGIAAGNTFFRDLRRQLPLMVLCVVGLVLAGFAGAGVLPSGGGFERLRRRCFRWCINLTGAGLGNLRRQETKTRQWVMR